MASSCDKRSALPKSTPRSRSSTKGCCATRSSVGGRPPLSPPWAFGPWISSDIWRSGGEVRYAVTQFRDRGIPASVFVFDSPWETAYNDFQFNMTQFAADATIDGNHYPGFTSVKELM